MYKLVSVSLSQSISSQSEKGHFVDCLDLTDSERVIHTYLKEDIKKCLTAYAKRFFGQQIPDDFRLNKKPKIDSDCFIERLLNDELWLESNVGFVEYDIDKTVKTVEELNLILKEGPSIDVKEQINDILKLDKKSFCADVFFSKYLACSVLSSKYNLKGNSTFKLAGNNSDIDDFYQYIFADSTGAGLQYIKVVPVLNLELIYKQFDEKYYLLVEAFYYSDEFLSKVNKLVYNKVIKDEMIYETSQGVLIKGLQTIMHRQSPNKEVNWINYLAAF